VARNVLRKIEELSGERERLLAREGTHHASEDDHQRLLRIDHDLQVLWDLRRRELAGEEINLDQDYYDGYDRYTDTDGPGS
jgi:hypothetical protein